MFILKYIKVPSFDYFVFCYFWINGRIKDQTLSKRPPCIISIGTFFTSTRHNRVCGRACRVPFSSLFLGFLDISSQHSVLEFLKASRLHKILFGSAKSFKSYRASGRDIQTDRRTDFFFNSVITMKITFCLYILHVWCGSKKNDLLWRKLSRTTINAAALLFNNKWLKTFCKSRIEWSCSEVNAVDFNREIQGVFQKYIFSFIQFGYWWFR